ncbi:MAG: glycosyltransferase family 39 protein [Deltaproteobacteria bacterium]|nr:glycosyltransferase family 39 protein [Deltaproteobacteria bacterium]MBN2674158.1 glycosyltransferase family 39 protein [Deltaproteobacteria bacterium]
MPSPFRAPFFILITFLLATSVFRLYLADKIGLSADEAYYYQWSQRLVLAYPDHPPMVAWLIRAGTEIAGANATGVRLFSIVFGALAGIVVYRIARELDFTKKQALQCALLENILLMPAVGALLMTPDVPLALGWVLSIWILVRLVKYGRIRELYLLILPICFACYAKHSGILLLPTSLYVIVATPKLRPLLKTIHPWVSFGIYLGGMTPWLAAEWHQQFASLLHQSAHAVGTLPGNHVSIVDFPIRWAELLLGQFGLLSPLVFIWSVEFARHIFKHPLPYLPVFAGVIIPVLATAAVALSTHPEQNWASIGHPLASILVVAALRERARFQQLFTWTFSTALLFTSIVHLHAVTPFLPLSPERDPLTRLAGWEQLASVSQELADLDCVICDNYGLAAQLNWQINRPQRRISIIGINRPYSKPTTGNWLILDEKDDFGNHTLLPACRAIEPLGQIVMIRGNTVLRVIDLSRGIHCESATVSH